jgi:asparagine synthase (glutamine-hydrolysing)
MGCGICGFVGLEDKQLLSRMSEVTRHRGPTHTDFFIDREVCLGCNRLSIIDLSNGNQPIHNEDQSVQVVFNGEIYNFVELRAELEMRGHSFYTRSDTETIVHGYEEWGEAVLAHLRGMFAFAIWDSTKRKLFLARDRFGKKPLYYAKIDGTLFFASEMKSLLQYERFPREVDDSLLDYYFTYLYVPSPLCFFRAARKLPPGHYLTYEKGDIRVKEYWDLAFLPKIEDLGEEAAVDHLYDLLLEAVKVRLRSDVPLGAFLSGGVDSSIVVALMRRAGAEKVRTFSIGFHEGYYNELPYAKEVAEFLSTDHTEKIVEPDVISLLPKLLWHFDEPYADSSMIPTYLVAEETKKDVTVALTGDGGDEIFVGYPTLSDPKIYEYYKRVPRPVRRAGVRAIAAVPIQSKWTMMARRALIMDYDDQSNEYRYFLRMSHFETARLRKLYSQRYRDDHEASNPELYLKPFFEKAAGLEYIEATDYVTIKTYLPEDILVKVDRMTMAVSLEARSPFLDHKVAEFVARLPVDVKMSGNQLKGLLKKTANRYKLVPNSTLKREKHGFGAPIDYWLRGQWKDIASSILTTERSKAIRKYFDKTEISKMLSNPLANRDRLFSLISFALWREIFVDSTDARPYLKVTL